MVAFARLHIAVLAVSKNCLVDEILVANSHLYYSGSAAGVYEISTQRPTMLNDLWTWPNKGQIIVSQNVPMVELIRCCRCTVEEKMRILFCWSPGTGPYKLSLIMNDIKFWPVHLTSICHPHGSIIDTGIQLLRLQRDTSTTATKTLPALLHTMIHLMTCKNNLNCSDSQQCSKRDIRYADQCIHFCICWRIYFLLPAPM